MNFRLFSKRENEKKRKSLSFCLIVLKIGEKNMYIKLHKYL